MEDLVRATPVSLSTPWTMAEGSWQVNGLEAG